MRGTLWDRLLLSVRELYQNQDITVNYDHNSTAALTDNVPTAEVLLGAGTFGRVFRVTVLTPDGTTTTAALKYTFGDENVDRLSTEYQYISECPQSMVGNCIVGVRPGSLLEGNIAVHGNNIPFAAYLMDTVGTPYRHWRDVLASHGPQILMSLSDLHAAKLVHGDARYRNVVKVNNNFLWIDFVEQRKASQSLIVADIKLFLTSVRRFTETKIPNIKQYATSVLAGSFVSDVARHAAVSALW